MTTAYRRLRDVVWRRSGDRLMIRRLDGECVVLEGLAAWVWLVLEDDMTAESVDETLAALSAQQGITRASRDVVATLDDLVGHRLVEPR